MASAIIFNAALALKYRGCLIGALIGDCLGGPFEADIHVSKSVLSKFLSNLLSGKSSQILPYSDDTCMTLSMASSLIEKGQVDAKDLAIKFVDEYFSQPKRGYGDHVVDVFRALKASNYEDVFLPAKLQFGGTGSYGNGAAMRTAPVPLFGHSKGEQYIMAAAEECARITHTHKNGYNGAILQSLAISAALRSDPAQNLNPSKFIDSLLDKMENVEKKDGTKTYCDSLKKIKEILSRNQADISSEKIADYLGNNVSAHRSVPTAIYSFLRGFEPLSDFESTNPFVRTMYFAISVGGDTDTIASMAGAIAGAFHGAEAIPEELQKRCEYLEEVIKLADGLFEASQK